MRIAIIGAGISGLVSAHLLHPDHEITLFEAEPYLGGHTNTVDVDLEGERLAIDTGFVVFNHRTYPNFTRLLERLDVASQPTSMSFSVRCDRTGLEYNGTSINRLFAQRSNVFRPRFLRMIADILRFHREAPALLDGDGDEGLTVARFVKDRRYGDAFVEQYLLPIGASIWSCPPGTFGSFPVRFVVEFFRNHGMLTVNDRPEWRVITGGSRRYVERLVRAFADRVRLACPVRGVRREAGAARVETDGGIETFDHVILACHADQALALLRDPSDLERRVLGAFPYERNEAILHTDPSVLPRKRLAWASWNYHRRSGPEGGASVTYNMNILQGLESRHVVCVTLNDEEGIDPARILRRFTYHHPVYTTERAAAQRRHRELIDANRTSFCGAYWGYGFHEDGVNSALAVGRAFGKSL